jgi:hypothetical protein
MGFDNKDSKQDTKKGFFAKLGEAKYCFAKDEICYGEKCMAWDNNHCVILEHYRLRIEKDNS